MTSMKTFILNIFNPDKSIALTMPIEHGGAVLAGLRRAYYELDLEKPDYEVIQKY